MSGDFGLRSVIPAVLQASSKYPELHFVLVGDERAIAAAIESTVDQSRLQIVHASEVIAMSEKPSAVLRNKGRSSMRVAIELLQAGQVDAVVSAGNTGALMALGYFLLQTLPGIDRPAICSALPTFTGSCYLLDLGANVDSSAVQLHQFAMMGAALAATIMAKPSPRIALLNIGEESQKGNEQVKAADELLKNDQHLNYIGYIEGDDIFSGRADVIVCDGFVGNVALKVCEGTASHIARLVREEFGRGPINRIRGLIARAVLRKVYDRVDPARYNGASLLGLQGVIVKSHGNSSADAFARAIEQAYFEVSKDAVAKIKNELARLAAQ